MILVNTHWYVLRELTEYTTQTNEYSCLDLYHLTQLLVSQCKANEQIAKGGWRNPLRNWDVRRPQTQAEFKELAHTLFRLILEIFPKPIDWTNIQLCEQI